MKLTQVVRWVWLTIAATLLVLLTVWGYEALLPIVGIALISFPAGLLAAPISNLVFDFPVAIEGIPFPPPWWLYGLLALVFGYLQWFVLLPIVVRRLTACHRATRMDYRGRFRSADAMNKQTARNVLVIVGAWALSATVAMLITLVLIPLNNRLTFRGDAGVVSMWVWSGLPEAVTAVGATLAVLWLIDTKKPYAWVGALAALYLYSGIIDAVRTRGGFQSAPTVLDNVGIIINGLMPAVACAIAAVWYQRQRSASVTRV